jgi:hypothetical protein
VAKLGARAPHERLDDMRARLAAIEQRDESLFSSDPAPRNTCVRERF